MDGLRPEMDELDRFKKRSTPTVKTEASKSKKVQSVPGPSQKNTSSLPITILILLIICGVAVFSWFSWKQQIEISSLQTQLGEASGFMGQSKLLIARLEGKLSETGVELAESGSAADKKLAFLDSEMRKLWGVAYDNNKKAIEDNKEALKNLEAKLLDAQKEQTASLKNFGQTVSGLSEELKKMSKDVEVYDARLGSLTNELSVLRAEQDVISADTKERFTAQSKNIDGVKKDTQNYLERTAKLDLSIESINASRRQLNERIVELDKKINALQLKISPSVN